MNLFTSICLCGLLACLAALAAVKTRRICRDVWRSFTGRRGAFAALAAFAVIATIIAQKPGPTPVITVDAFLRDAGCYATNNVLHVAVTNAPAYAGIDFSSCPVLVYARPRGLSDAPWEELFPRRTFSEHPADYAIEDATNYNYLVYLDYVPPSPVHTNGVFELRGFVVPGDEPGNLEQLAAGFINSRAILPPPTARDYVQDGLIAMWDGIENAGWGQHHNDAPIDLMGGVQLIAQGSPVVTATTFDTPQGAYYYADIPAFKDAIANRCFTFEAVLSDGLAGNNGIFSIGNRGLWIYGNASYNLETVNALATSYNQGFTSLKYTADGAFRISVVGDTTLKVIIGGSERSGNYGSLASMTGTRCYIGGMNAVSGFSSALKSFRNIRLYNRALTADEIRHNYEIDKERFNLP